MRGRHQPEIGKVKAETRETMTQPAGDGLVVPTYRLLKEDGNAILLENGGRLLLQAAP